MPTKPANPNEVTLTAVRLSYPQLFVAKSIQGGAPTFGAAFLMDKINDADQILACRQAMTAAAKEKWGDKIPKLEPSRLALKDGAFKETEGYGDGVMYVQTSAKRQPVVVDKNPNVILNRDTGQKVYAGCYVNAKIRFWCLDDPAHPEWGKRVCAQLLAVQFVADGEAFGEAPVQANEVFDDISDGTEEDPFNGAGSSGSNDGGLLG